ncbi:hypothetical protein ACSBR1_035405 [Camellia fascicularis]
MACTLIVKIRNCGYVMNTGEKFYEKNWDMFVKLGKTQLNLGVVAVQFWTVCGSVWTRQHTNACKDMLLHPRTPGETISKGLKINVNDTKPTAYFICSDLSCSRNQSGGLLSNYANTKCKCGKLINREIFMSSSTNSVNATDGIFVKPSTTYIVSDNLVVMSSTPGVLVELLGNLAIKDVNRLKERVVKLGSDEFRPNWTGPYIIKSIWSGGAVVLMDLDGLEFSQPINMDKF